MSEKQIFKKRLFPILFMLAITVVFISVTTAIYTFTEEKIKINEKLVLKRAVLSAAGVTLPEDPAGIDNLYNRVVQEITDSSGKVLYYEVAESEYSSGKAYVIITTGSGLWGDITAAVGIDENVDTLTGIEIIDQNETPGLGGRITENWFTTQFRGKKGPLNSVPEGQTTSEQQFQAITGASYSTAAIKSIVNATLEDARGRIKS
jgi:Na+-transporting NADH:ubiquinone oxidoreductase subunit C